MLLYDFKMPFGLDGQTMVDVDRVTLLVQAQVHKLTAEFAIPEVVAESHRAHQHLAQTTNNTPISMDF